MLGGGVFTKQDQVLPGAYINFVSAAAPGVNDAVRGVAAIPMELGWGPEFEVVKVTKEAFEGDCMRILGYPRTAPQMLPLREIFKNAVMVYVYRVNSEGARASCIHAQANYTGVRGNAIKLVIQRNIDDDTKYDVKTVIDMTVIDTQTVSSAAELTDNVLVSFKADVNLAETAGISLTGGTDGSVTGKSYQGFLDAMEQYPFHVVGCPTKDESTVNLFAAYTKRLREELGILIQTVVYRAPGADHEGIISVENKAEENETGMVYWTVGAAAACASNKSITNKKYDGEYTVGVSYTQGQLADAIHAGKFMFHRVGDEVRVLRDINTLVTFTEEKNREFSDNQTIRVLDTIGNGVASLFSGRFMGQVPNDDAGRVSLWSEIVTFCKTLAAQRAVEGIDPKGITVEAGETKRSVVVHVPVQPINCMDQLYMTVVVK